MDDRPPVLSRQEQQRRTRDALVLAARAVFARDGFHGARLDVIAQEAGYSKGAVYSNFENKANLFLAVLDININAVIEAPADSEVTLGALIENDPEFDQAVRGMSLATLEFVAMAARNEDLARECGKRVELLVAGYADLAAASGATTGEITVREIGALLAALDQGSAILSLAGAQPITSRALELGMRAVASIESDDLTGPLGDDDAAQAQRPKVGPDRVAEPGQPQSPGAWGADALSGHQRLVRERLAASIARQNADVQSEGGGA